MEYLQAHAHGSGLPARSVDLAAAAQAAHWFDLPRYYEEVRRVARPGALVGLASYGSPVATGTVEPVLRHFHREVLAPHWPPERRHVDEGYTSLPFPFEELSAPPFHMEVRWSLPELLGYVGTWSAVRRLESAGGGEALAGFRRELAEAWGDPDHLRSISWPLALRLGRVR